MGLTSGGSLVFFLFHGLQFASDANFQYRAKTKSFDTDFHRLFVNAAVSKAFGMNKNFKVSVSVRDLLNQNTGFERTASANLIIQNRYSTIKRYLIVSASWDFSTIKGAKN